MSSRSFSPRGEKESPASDSSPAGDSSPTGDLQATGRTGESMEKGLPPLDPSLGLGFPASSLRSKSTREEDELWPEDGAAISTDNGADEVAVFVGSSRRRYLVNSKHLNHPLLSALIDRSMHGEIRIKCEVVLFDHLLWMLENAELDAADDAATLEELAELYAC
ncbi:hypothetical protein BHE74_00021166 [Ensete ventricosum]|nr:hypothetical protein BHE74_00021166 [Ensete ventricosum]